MSMGQTEGLKKLREMRKDRARMLTYLREARTGGSDEVDGEETEQGRDCETPGHKNEKVGEVVSTKMQKTIVVQVSRRVPHPLYKRIVDEAQEVLRARRRGHGQRGRHGADRRVPPAEQAEALETRRSGAPRGAGWRAAAVRSRRKGLVSDRLQAWAFKAF